VAWTASNGQLGTAVVDIYELVTVNGVTLTAGVPLTLTLTQAAF
jgi:hypothetical protein